MRRPSVFLALVLAAALTLGGCARINTMMGEIAAAAMTESTDDLGTTNRTIAYLDRTPPDIGVADYNWLGGMEADQPIATAAFYPRAGLGFVALDGNVTAAGTETEQGIGGVRYAVVPNGEPVTLAIETGTGQSEQFQVQPLAPIRVTRVNGQAVGDGISISDAEPLVIELDRQPTDRATMLRIALPTKKSLAVPSILQQIAFVEPAARVVIPAEMLQQNLALRDGDTWLVVEEHAWDGYAASATGGLTTRLAISADYVPLSLATTASGGDIVAGSRGDNALGAEGEVDSASWSASRSGPPAPGLVGARIAPVSFTVRARNLSQSEVSTRTTEGPVVSTTTTTTRTRQFAQLPAAFYQQLATDLYADVSAALTSVAGAEMVPVQQVAQSAAYQRYPDGETTSMEVFAQASLPGLRPVDAPTSFFGALGEAQNLTGFYEADAYRVIEELGVDAVLSASLDLTMPDDEFSLTPKFALEIKGAQQTFYAAAPILLRAYANGEGQEVTNAMLDDPQQLRTFLNTAANTDAIAAAFRAALAEIVMRERATQGYTAPGGSR